MEISIWPACCITHGRRQLKRRQRGESQPDLLNDQKSLSSFFRLRTLFAHIKKVACGISRRAVKGSGKIIMRTYCGCTHFFSPFASVFGEMEVTKLEKAPLKVCAIFQQFLLLQLASNYETRDQN